MKILVTGGGGFIGRAIAKRLKLEGHDVISFSRKDYPELAEANIQHKRGNLSSFHSLKDAAKDVDVMIHTAAKASIWGRKEDFWESNVLGTENVLQVCRALGIRYLVFTSSPSVVFSGQDQEGLNEKELGYPSSYLSEYSRTKAEAEKRVLAANSPTLATIALRPHIVWGPGDPHFLPKIITRARANRLWLIEGGENKIDTLFLHNAVDAHLYALKALINKPVEVSGKPYFITNGEPMPLRVFLNKMLAAGSYPEVTRSIPKNLAWLIAVMNEKIYQMLGIQKEPLLTRFVVKEMSSAHWYSIEAAKKDLGYKPSVSIDEGMRQIKNSLRPQIQEL